MSTKNLRRTIVCALILVSILTVALLLNLRSNDALPGIVAQTPEENALGTGDAIALGVVEGVTEYLPVSSTGHLLLAQRALGISSDSTQEAAADSYAIVIQFGAILAVVFLYWRRLVSILQGIAGRNREGRRLALVLATSFLPAAAIGVLGEKYIKDYLFAPWPIIAAWVVGGVVILAVAHHDRRSGLKPDAGARIEDLTARQAVVIGLLQSAAMWPGVSRSLSTILGGRLVGLSTTAAVEYSFLLGLVTLTAATIFEAVSKGGEIVANFGVVTPLVGVITAFIAAALAIRWMVSYLRQHTLALFGWYRIGLSVVAAALILTGLL